MLEHSIIAAFAYAEEAHIINVIDSKRHYLCVH